MRLSFCLIVVWEMCVGGECYVAGLCSEMHVDVVYKLFVKISKGSVCSLMDKCDKLGIIEEEAGELFKCPL
ncbi:hypothetical protein DCAR_0414955 [Daucus carota subsp. sativus]|uniref:Uncharacterized protein n=1 Tax=Daucus carota subsp. sativus TaxID=79200 RepID=A0A165A463_DAUCS|nr:hypothetical protein DCAR_0414955 [Daucus carota subsp. sativus]